IPFAGHPNVGTAFVLASRAKSPPAKLLFEEKAGLVPVEITSANGKVVNAELTAPQPLKRLTQVPVEKAAACLSLSAADIRTDRHQTHIISVGLPFLAVEVAASESPCNVQARMFHPGASGLTEDPATGSATAAAAALFPDLDGVSEGELKMTIGQGFDM